MRGADQCDSAAGSGNRTRADPGVEIRQSHFQITLRNLRGVSVHRIDDDLYGCRLSAAETTRKIGRDDQEQIQVQTFESIFSVLRARIDAFYREIYVPGQRVDEIPAFYGEVFIHHAKAKIADSGVQSVSENDQYDRWRQHQLNNQTTVALELLNFLEQQCVITTYHGAHHTLLSLELHLAHLEHIHSEERKR